MSVEKRLTNRASFPLEELAKYAGEWVAWEADGTRVITHGADFSAAHQAVVDLGENPETVSFEFIPPLDAGIIGAAS